VTVERVSSDPAVFRHVLGHFATGVTVVTGMDESEPVGFTCQAFAALSLDPALVTIAPALTSTSWPRIARGGVFCVNVLASGEDELARHFAVSGGRKFDDVPWTASTTGCPVLQRVLAFIDCRIEATYTGGDHVVVTGRVLDLGTGAAAGRGPLLFYKGNYGHFVTGPEDAAEPGNAAEPGDAAGEP
jgi:3-hydroxy-9,10-secoandrosta-1,3,5(10)-triene-9,17-dione monooxygenase reductase component